MTASHTLVFERDALWPALQTVNKVVERKSTIPILGNILFRSLGGQEAMSGKAGIAATDMDIWAEVAVPVDGLQLVENFASTIPGAQLHDLIRRIPEGAQVSLAFSETNVVIRSGKARFTLPTLPGADFPLTLAEMSGECAFRAPCKDLARILDTTAFAQNTGKDRPFLAGTYFHVVDDDGVALLRAVATDGHRLARDQIALPNYAEKMPGVILPPKLINEAIRLLGQAKAGEHCEVEASKAKIRISQGDTTIVSKLVEGNYPDYQRIVPRDSPYHLIAEKQALVTAIDRIAAVTPESRRGIAFAMQPAQAVLSSQGADGGDATDEIEAEWDGPEGFTFACRTRYLLDILGAMEADTVTLRFVDASAAILIEARAGVPAQFILMPVGT
ncbi:DNA polymerase III subunit beta [Labrys sp. KB_33_2]|uniref:DNA polymerase III subunit beta n=1 Tax=Labrys sp. KB_33_2 TaxID=3237479 RepID=UPI003F8EE50C